MHAVGDAQGDSMQTARDLLLKAHSYPVPQTSEPETDAEARTQGP